MAVTFNIQFRISVATKVIRLTDTSTGFTYGNGCFKVEFPNGVVRNLPDFSTPDISTAGNFIDIPCELDVSGNVVTGSYIISYAVINNLSAGQTPLVRTFDFNWVEPSNGITNFSDVIIPEVVFKDLTSYSPIGSFTGALTRTISGSFPSTSEASANSPITSTSTNTITVVSGANYYEGSYTPTSNVSVAYTHSSNAWLTILYTRTFSKTFAIKKCPNQLELVQKINAYRVIIDAYKETNDTQFNLLSEQYDLVIALYSHLIARYSTNTQDGSETILIELLSILEPYTGTYTYQSTKMLPFELTSSGTNSFNISDGTNVDAIQLGSTLTFSSGNASLVPIVTNNVVTYSPTFGTLINTFAQGNDSRFHNPVTIGTANGLSISTQALSLAAATSGSAGAMSASDKTKLDGIATGATANVGTVTSVALTAPAAFTVTGSPITTAGTLAIAAAGTSLQYITGAGALATLNTANVPENTNLYFTASRARTSISLTTTGTSGAATYDNTTGVLNIPNYIGGVTSFNTRTGAIVLSGTDVTTALSFTPYNATNPAGYISSITSGNVTGALGYTPENAANKGIANGYASLDGGGLVPSTQLPSYVDDVLEYTNLATFPASGTTGKIYVALDTNKIYRWSGSVYIEVSPSVGTIWGGISGTLSNQTDLQNALNLKYNTPTGTTAQYVAGDGSLIAFPVAGQSGTIVRLVRNTTGATLTKGTVVYISGATGNNPIVSKAIATGDSTSAQTFGLLQADIANNATGYVVTMGDLIGLDTSAFTEGQQVYLSGTVAGTYTATKTLAPTHLVYIGIITRSHPTLGQIEVKVQNGYELDEIHDVSAQNPANNDIIAYNTSSGLWEKKSIATTLGFTPVTNARTITINGTALDLTANRSYSVGTVTSVSALTLGTTGTDVSSTVATGTTTPAITLNIPTASASNRGALSSADWTTFNGKQSALGYTAANDSLVVHLAGTETITGQKTFNASVTAASAIAIGTYLTPTLVASANSDVLIGLDINPTFTLGAYTGVSKIGLRTPEFIFYSDTANNNYIQSRGQSTNFLGSNTSAVVAFYGGNAYTSGSGIAVTGPANSSIGNNQIAFYTNTFIRTFAQFTSGNWLIQNGGTFTDAGYRLDVNGTARIQNALTLSGSVTGVGNLSNYTVTASAGSAISKKITSTLVAAANSDVLVGLDINPTFTTGAFTGVQTYGLRVTGNSSFTIPSIGNLTIQSAGNQPGISFNQSGGAERGSIKINGGSQEQFNFISNVATGTFIWFTNTSTQIAKLFSTGNFTLQNGGTFTDAGYRLDVAGTTRFQGTTASDSAPLGSELATVTGTGANWTLAGTNLNVGGYTHTTGSVVPLTTSLAAVSGTYYQITYTITGRTAGSITIAYGGTSTSVSATGNTGPLASSTGVLTITPTTDFDGTVVLSIKSIGTSSASSTFANSSGTNNIEVRASSITTNTFIGLDSGRRNTIGTSNTFIGTSAGANNTTGGANSLFGQNAGVNITIGGLNTFIGNSSGLSTSTGTENTAIGSASFTANISGIRNISVGSSSLSSNTAGSFNSAIGHGSMLALTSGSNNIAIGYNTGRFFGGSTSNALTSSDTSIFIGTQAYAAGNSQTNQIVIGFQTTGLGSNTTVLGNSSTATTAIYGNLVLGSTADAGYKLDVTGTARTTGATYLSTSGANVGIGTTSPAGISTYTTLDIRGATGGGIKIGKTGFNPLNIQHDGTDAYINNVANGAFNIYTNDAPRVIVTAAGNVGIGTATPLVNSNQTSLTINGTNNSRLDMQVSGTRNAGFVVASDAAYLETTAAIPLVFYTNSSERMRITSGGSVLISTTSTTGNATGGSTNVGSVIGGGTITTQRNDDANMFLSKASGFTEGILINFFAIGTSRGNISTNGVNTSYNTSSDYRLKEDLKEYNGLNIISKLKTYDFKWKDTNIRDYGMMAHELQEILPNYVTGNKDAVNEDGTIKIQAVDYSKIVPVLVKAIQELSAKVSLLENK